MMISALKMIADRIALCGVPRYMMLSAASPGGNRRGGQRVVAGDHDGTDAGAAQLGEALANAALDDVLQVDDPEQAAIQRDGKRRAALLRDPVGDLGQLAGRSRDGGRG